MKNVEDGDDVEVYHIGQGQGHDFDPDYIDSERSARVENTEPQCMSNAFLFAASFDEAFTSTYGTVQNLKVQYGKFRNSNTLGVASCKKAIRKNKSIRKNLRKLP